MFAIDRPSGRLFHDGRAYTPATRSWQEALLPAGAEPADPIEALAWLQRESGHCSQLQAIEGLSKVGSRLPHRRA